MRTISDKIDAITEMGPEKQSPTPPMPKSCKIELTATCNLQCAFCATSHGLREKGKMSFEFYSETLLPQLKEAGVQEVGMFFLGESTTMKDLPRYIEEARRQGFPYIFLTTNGTALTPEKIESYMKAGLDSLKFSMNYADAEQFVDIAQVKPALFLKLIGAIKEAHRIRERGGYDCGLYASYIEYDDAQGEKMLELVDKMRPYLDEVYGLPLYSQADLVGEENERRGWKVSGGNPGRAENPRPAVPCWSLFGEARVAWDGELSMCCFNADHRFDAGNLNTMTFRDAWHSAKFQELRAAHLTGDVRETECAGCVSYE
jgi:MoaA/NifB/PqqE/SkfB family radical SAM enzyme